MKKNYILSFALFSLFSLNITAQENSSYNDDNAIQKTISFSDSSLTKEEAINDFFKSYKLNNENTYKLIRATNDVAGYTHERYQQYYKGIKVEYGVFIVHSKDGVVMSINGELYNASNVDVNPRIAANQCFDLALANRPAQKYLWDDVQQAQVMNYQKPAGELVIYSNIISGKVVLAYKYDIYAVSPISRDEVYVDATSGEILFRNAIIKHANKLATPGEIAEMNSKVEALATGSATTRYSGVRNIETSLDSGLAKYVLSDVTRGNGIVTYNSGRTNTYPSTHFQDDNNIWSEYANTNKDDAALDAHWGAEMTYDFWKNIFNRNGFDGNNTQLRSYVHYDDNPATTAGYFNAFWNGSVMTYGDGSSNPLTAIDICGHEIGHAVCEYTANLVYANQSGAMNEGFSDIWGACIEQYGENGNLNAAADTASPGTSQIWKVGENVSSGGMRSMSYPNTKSNPDTFKGTYYTTTANDGNCTPSNANDQCGVHNNSGVLNHWFYILTAGKAGTNNATVTFGGPDTYNVTGIGMTKSSQIAYYAERDYLTPNSTFTDARNATIAVANTLYCASSPEVIAVTNAWFAVNVGNAYVGYTNDVTIKSIVGQTNVACGSSYSPSIVLENAGSANITSITVTYNINGGSNTTTTWTGNLANCSSFSLPIPVSGLANGTNVLNVTATVSGDGNALNGTKSALILVNTIGVVNTVKAFESNNDALVSVDKNGRTSTVWERGSISKTLLSNAVAGSQVYATKLSGNYPDKTTSYLVSQCYNLSNIINPSVNFDMAFDLESNWDIIYFEYSTDSGATWNVLGTSADANWYNSSRTPNGTDCFNCIGKQWTGDYATAPTGGTGVNGNKRNYSHSLTSLGSPSNVMFRFVFISDDSVNQEGVFIDNFVVQGTLSRGENSFEQFAVYPNPSKGKFNVILSTSEEVKVEVFDIRGRSVYNKTHKSEGAIFNKEIDLNTISSGVYILNIESAGKKEARRIIIE